MQTLTKLTLLSILCLVAFGAKAQVLINSLGQANAYTQNFNGFSSSANVAWTNNSTLANWYADRTNGNLTTLTASNGTNSTGSLYNFGSAGSSDRALGSVGSGNTKDYYWGVRMKNNTTATITAFYISFTGEQWRNSKAAAQGLTFSYRTSNSAINSVTSGTWTAVPALGFSSPVKGGTAGSLDGNAAANRLVVSYTLTGISLAPGSEIMFRWVDINHKSNDHGLAIDDLSIAALTPNQFYSKANSNLNLLSSWGTSTNGTGTAPASFTAQGQIFNIRNSAAQTISGNWTISGFGSKAVLNNTGSAINFTIPAGLTMTGIMDLASAATLTINSNSAPAIGSVATTSTIVYGNGMQTLVGGTYGNLTIAGGGNKRLAGPITVTGILTFLSGSLELGDNDLTMNSGSSITGATAANYVKTTGIGMLVRAVAKGSTVTFPIGTATSYNPAVITLTNNSTDDNFSASVSPKLYTDYDESNQPFGSEITAKAVDRTWEITEETEGGSNATVQLQWNTSDELTGLNRTQVNVAQYSATGWASSAFAAASGTNPYTRSLAGLTTFGIFGVTDKNVSYKMEPLPVELLSFKATAKGNLAELTWATATEMNNEKFVVERSLNGQTWTAAGEVKGHGNSTVENRYAFQDKNYSNATQVYYRLKQVDLDGTFTYSNTTVVTFGRKTENPVTVLANPVQDKVQFNLNGNTLQQATLEVYTTGGVRVLSETLTENNALTGTDVTKLATGIYIYRIVDQQQILSSGRLVKTN